MQLQERVGIEGHCKGFQTELDFVKKNGILTPVDTGIIVPGTMFNKSIGSVTHEIIQLKINIHIVAKNTDQGVMSSVVIKGSNQLTEQTSTWRDLRLTSGLLI